MGSAADIRDEDSLRAWLEGRPREDAVAIAARAALRVAPLFWEWVSDQRENAGLTEVAVLRATAVAALLAVRPGAALRACAGPASVSAAAVATTTAAFGTAAAATAAAAVATAARAAAGQAPPVDGAGFAARATTAVVDAAVTWQVVSDDAVDIAAGRDPFHRALWPDEVARRRRSVHDGWRDRGGGWVFWADWYAGYLAGKPPDPDLLEQVALIAPEDWDRGETHVNGIIAGIYDPWRAGPGGLARALAAVPRAAPEAVSALQRAVVLNRAALPPTFDALEGLLALEIARLQGRNFRDDLDRDESRRLIGVFAALLEAVQQLRATVPVQGAPTDGQAAQMAGLLALYRQKVAEWPRTNADDLVDGSFRLGIVGASAGLMVAFGVPAWAALAIGGTALGGKRVADALKAARDARDLLR